MAKVGKSILAEIAEQLDYRNICFYTTENKKTNAIPSCLFTS
jgi:hypothetical protein